MRFTRVLLFALLVSATPAVFRTELRSADQADVQAGSRELFQALQLRDGGAVADIGSGDGFFSFQLADQVGPEGRVIAIDIDRAALERLKDQAGRSSIGHIETMPGDAAEIALEPRSLDAVLIMRAYHEFKQPQQVLARVRTALKPAGRLVVVDEEPSTRDRSSRESQVRSHEISSDLVQRELSDAGFRIVQKLDSFRLQRRSRTAEVWLLAAEPGL